MKERLEGSSRYELCEFMETQVQKGILLTRYNDQKKNGTDSRQLASRRGSSKRNGRDRKAKERSIMICRSVFEGIPIGEGSSGPS